MKHLSESDQRLVCRFLDGELTGDELADLERRVLRERGMREAVETQREVKDWFARARQASGTAVHAQPSAGFAVGVMDRVRDLPAREELMGEAAVVGEAESNERAAIATGRGILVAAAVILGVSLLFAGGLIPKPHSGRLEAADEKLIEQIDLERREAERRRDSEWRRR